MSAVSVRPINENSKSNPPSTNAPRRWIINSWVDLILILLTPLIATPAILILYSPVFQVKAETISLIVTAFFATGHHLPGLIRAYGDQELFQRFRWRFILAPPLVFLAYFPLYNYHFDLYRLIILIWATWHGLMQLYGFVRIYDAKVGSTAPATAYWDWLICLCGFITPQFFRPEKLSSALHHWYSIGGPFIPPTALTAARWAGTAITGVVLIGFSVNYVTQSYRGPKPNPLKLLMLASGIGIWSYTVIAIENLVLGVALFDICHDVQYLAIVWLYNCRRVSSNPQLSGFMRYLFRRGMVLLYLGLITAYGAIGLLGSTVSDDTISKIVYGVLFTSTILHYYYDGFIWKVREATNQIGLGINQQGVDSRPRQISASDFAHLLKWSPAIIVGGVLFASDWNDPPVTQARKLALEQTFSNQLLGSFRPPQNVEERSWLFELFQRTQSIANAVPDDRYAGLRAAVMLANFGRNDEAVASLQKLLKQFPGFSEAYLTLGGIHLYRGNNKEASEYIQAALKSATTDLERANANVKLGELHLSQHDRASAEADFEQALRDNPTLKETINSLYKQSAQP
jgi:tetratricopeptide (TPR) repeat protein